TRSSFDGRDSYHHLDLARCAEALADSGAALHPALRRDAAPPTPPAGQQRSPHVVVLFVCTGNSARSPIAQALPRHHTPPPPPRPRHRPHRRSPPQPPPAPQHHSGAARGVRHQHLRPVPRASGHPRRPPVRPCDHSVRQGPRGLPAIPPPPAASPLERP